MEGPKAKAKGRGSGLPRPRTARAAPAVATAPTTAPATAPAVAIAPTAPTIAPKPPASRTATIIELIDRRLHEAFHLLEARIGAKSALQLLVAFESRRLQVSAKRILEGGAPPVLHNAMLYIAMQLELSCRKESYHDATVTGVVAEITSNGRGHFTSTYSNAAYQIADLLRDPRGELFAAILEGRARPGNVTCEDVMNLCPSILRAERDEIELRKQQKIEQKTSAAHLCRKCGKRETLVREIQIRGSDEAPTLAIQCVNCGNCWTQSA
jgi:DNA-directed RNA polymerase subunit M/transcription elongation factor TFIIS